MSDVAIRVEGLAKRYTLGEDASARMLKEAVAQALGRPWRRLTGGPPPAARPEDGDGIWALRDVSFEIPPGQVLGVIGRNGAGKSTLLKILARIVAPTEGRAEIFGRVGSLLEIGTGFHPELTGRENIFLNGTVLGLRRREVQARFDAIVDFSGLERFLDTPVKRYSSGMYTRLAFAVAAHIDPDVLLVDEVLAVGDADFQRKCVGKMREAAGEGHTVMLVSHNLGAVLELTSRCLLLEGGRVVADGPPDGAIAAYLSAVRPGYSRDLRDHPRPSWVPRTRSWEFTRAAIVAPPGGVLAYAPLEVAVEFECFRPVGGVAITIGVAHPNGTRLITTCSADGRRTFDFAAGARGRLVVRIEGPRLSSGRYLLYLSAASGGQSALDAVPDGLLFDVHPDATDALMLSRLHDENLGVRLTADWRREPDAEPAAVPPADQRGAG
jgi:homopolymeric O-antigen transport system ATP-binding protein